MANWEMTCSCGDTMQMEGSTKEEAVDKLLGFMTPEATMAHMGEKHSGQAMPTPEEIRMGFLSTAQKVFGLS